MNGDAIGFLFSLAIILFFTKALGLLMRKIGLPQVLGFVLAGILVGPSIWSLIFKNAAAGFSSWLLPVTSSDRLKTFAEVGVVLVMFMAGLETNMEELKKTGFVSLMIAMAGVAVPFGLGVLAGSVFLPEAGANAWVFFGTIVSATSVGISVETLREMGKLKGKVGTVILSAAIIDDMLGIMVLSIVMNLEANGARGVQGSPVLSFINPSNSIFVSILWMFAYFAFAIVAGIGISDVFKKLEDRHPKTRRLLIYALVTCFMHAFIAEKVFGVAEITGAFIAGAILSTVRKSSDYIDKRVSTPSYLIFGPVFFASIGINMNFSGVDSHILLFALVFVLLAIVGKIIGCGGAARLFGFSTSGSISIGCGMVARGEVALVVANKGIDAGIIDEKHLFVVVMLVLITSVAAPVLLNVSFKDKRQAGNL
ncbi:MAG TPA: sodium:proton antiporter [Spirochaetaceae bacterium]|nr:sodium:proton antiporter [Spirochaetaceae bacterium]